MSYNTIVRMANDGDLRQRFVAAAGREGIPNPDSWVASYWWTLVSLDSQMEADYQYAVDLDNVGVGRYGLREDVVNDAKILSVVQAQIAGPTPPPEEPVE